MEIVTPEEVIDIFRAAGALLEGHFRFSSGRHGRQFLQAARVLQYPKYTESLCKAIAAAYVDERIDLVAGPAIGGILLAYETARALGCRAVFTEKDGEGEMALKRGFALQRSARALVVEDIVTTGSSVQKTVKHLRQRGAEVVGVAVLIDRSAGEARFNCTYTPLATLDMESWTPESCPLCENGEQLMEPDDLTG